MRECGFWGAREGDALEANEMERRMSRAEEACCRAGPTSRRECAGGAIRLATGVAGTARVPVGGGAGGELLEPHEEGRR